MLGKRWQKNGIEFTTFSAAKCCQPGNDAAHIKHPHKGMEPPREGYRFWMADFSSTQLRHLLALNQAVWTRPVDGGGSRRVYKSREKTKPNASH